MKKILSTLVALTVCAALTACGGDDGTAADNTLTTDVNTATETTVAAETTMTTTEPQETLPEEPEETAADITTVSETTTTTAAELKDVAETTAEAETAASESETETEAVESEDEPVSDEEIVIADDVEDEPVNSTFADMDEFLSADLFMLDGKSVTADKSLSASIFDTLEGDFFFETSELDGSTPFRFAVKGKMIMTESEMEGKTHKMIIRDSKAYTFDHENKLALYLPAENELISQYAPDKMGIIPENVNKENFVIADVKIGGKDYKFEYGTTSDWAMLYTSDGKLYASVKSGDSLDCVLCKFSVTRKIPSGTFDIPEDYFPVDLEEMMQNAPPPEEME